MILLVEDSPEDQDLIVLALRRSRIDLPVVIASTAWEALTFLDMKMIRKGQTTTSLPQLALLDVGLPGMDGIELLRRIRNKPKTAELPVIMLTYSEEQQHLIDAFRLSAQGYILKWPDYQKFTDTVAKEVRLLLARASERP